MPQVSVIVPVYNVEKYIARCVDSILAQTFTDFELILVDDGSSDCSGELCDRYSLEDNRITVVHTKNKGVSAARNKGIELSRGDWVTFIDSDDYVLPEYLRSLYLNSKKYRSDFVMTGIIRIFEDNSHPQEIREWPEMVVDKANIECLYSGNVLQYQKGPVIKLFKRVIINKYGLCFDEKLSRGEDALFVYSYLLHCETISVAMGANYVYCLRPGSLMSQKLADFEDEYYGYNCMKALLLNLTVLPHPYPKMFLIYWFERVLNSIYANNYSFRKRMMLLKTLDYDYYREWKEPVSWKENIKKNLLCSKLFLIFDVLSKVSK